MKPQSLRQFAKRHGVPGLLLAGTYLLLKHLWIKKRIALVFCLIVVVVTTYAHNLCYHHRVSSNGHRLYLGPLRREAPPAPQTLETRLLDCWTEDRRTEEVRSWASAFATSIQRRDHEQAAVAANKLSLRFGPQEWVSWNTDGKWLLLAKIGQIYGEEGWLAEAEPTLKTVLSSVARSKPWGRSTARADAAYGLARLYALRGSYAEALKWLADAPQEYVSGCGNHSEAVATHNYPSEMVWTLANNPSYASLATLKAVMGGEFTPRHSRLNGDTSEEQRQQAAAEAGLTLGCLHYKAGRYVEAAAYWSLVASNASSQYDATHLAQVMLTQLRHD